MKLLLTIEDEYGCVLESLVFDPARWDNGFVKASTPRTNQVIAKIRKVSEE